jgi:nicotinic acid mononucleotide adenylyltransferase
VRELTGVHLPESSTGIREQLQRGVSDVPVPEPVLRYIHDHGLYGRGLSL